MIYEIDERIEMLLELQGGELTEEIEKLEAEKEQYLHYLENVTRCYLNELARIEGMQAELVRLQQLKANSQERVEKLKYTASKLVGHGNKHDLGFAKISWRASEAVEIEEGKEENLPLPFLTVKTVPNKIAIKEALRNGEVIDGCSITKKNNIVIR